MAQNSLDRNFTLFRYMNGETQGCVFDVYSYLRFAIQKYTPNQENLVGSGCSDHPLPTERLVPTRQAALGLVGECKLWEDGLELTI